MPNPRAGARQSALAGEWPAGGEVLLPAWGVKTRAGLPLETTVRAVLSVSYA